jgi:hypothetical protein
VLLGDDGKYWVAPARLAGELNRAGYEHATDSRAKDAAQISFTGPREGYNHRREWDANDESGKKVGYIAETHFDFVTKPFYYTKFGNEKGVEFRSLSEAQSYMRSQYEKTRATDKQRAKDSAIQPVPVPVPVPVRTRTRIK